MRITRNFVVAALTLGAAGAAHAQEVKPVQYQGVELGRVAGDFYYTVQPDGYHVVATFAEPGEKSVPMRFESVLAAGQRVTFSTPRGVGEPAVSVQVIRQSDRVIVRKADKLD